MAPANGSSKARKPAANKQAAGPRPVVPAIPLPYVKRQAAAAAAAAASAPTSPLHDTDKKGTNGVPASETKEAAEVTESVASPPIYTNGQTSTPPTDAVVLSTPNTRDANSVVVTPATTTVPDTVEPAVPEQTSETPTVPNGVTVSEPEPEPNHKPAVEQPSVTIPKPRPPPSMSPTRYHMPPPFQPASRPLGMRQPMNNGPPHPHQAHPSNGSVHFGAFHDSTSSSPVPPHSGGIAPPPGMQGPDGRQPYMGPVSNGYPPWMPYGGDMMPGSNFDSYGRPAMGFAPMDSYPAYGNNFGPSTPHSFHGSQSSAHPDDSGMYNQFPLGGPGGSRNNANGPGDDQAQNHQGRMFGAPEHPRMMPNHGMPPQMTPQGDDADGLIGHLQQQFAAPELSDCTLELRYLDDRAAPVRIPGHRVVLSRSPQISTLLRKQAYQTGPSDHPQILLLETDSKWIRSEAFYMGVQRLYGVPLLPIPPRSGMDGEVVAAGSARERLSFALAYAAAGHLLQWSSLVRRGSVIATQILDWETIETAVEFALEEYSDRGTHESFKYGEGSKRLLHAVVTFIVHNLPLGFAIDTSVPQPEHYARLPGYAPVPASSESDTTSPTIARGTSMQLGKGRHSRKLSTIQFGDLSVEEAQNDASDTPRASRPAQPVSHALLSRILLNLPFGQLKMILESSGSGNVSGWANAEARYRTIKDVVEERERRRRGAVDAVISGRVPNAGAIQACLRSPEPQTSGQYTSLGWQEEILPYGNTDGPSLVRKWVPLMDASHDLTAAYP